jgi:hypothetical protein
MKRFVHALSLTLLIATTASAGRLADGVLTVDGKPFYPLGSWNYSYTTPEDIDRLGMNTSFRGGPGSDETVENFRPFMRRCAELGIQVVPYLSYGGAGVTPWAPESVRSISRLASEPNLLAWYVGDDIVMKHLSGIRQTVSILREETPDLATVADYIASTTPEAKTVFTQYVDIRCQYDYPVPHDSISTYMAFFDHQREFVGDPLWTWVQSFMWGSTGKEFSLGAEGAGPLPDPEQVRLLAFAAINRGVRGLLFFPHIELQLLPELAAEVAMTCREAGLFNDHLAAGKITMNLLASDPEVNAASFQYGNSTVVSAMLARDTYHRWIDEAIVRDVTIDVPWSGSDMPTAALVATPDVIECSVAAGNHPGTVRLTIPRLEVAGFVLLTTDQDELAAVRQNVAEAVRKLAILAVPGAVAQTRKVGALAWRVGVAELSSGAHSTMLLDATRANERGMQALVDGEQVEVIRNWRLTMRLCRKTIDRLMHFAFSRKYIIPANQHRYMHTPYALPLIHNLAQSPAEDDPWSFVRDWMITGPFPLEGHEDADVIAPGFVRAFPPEAQQDGASATEYSTPDDRVEWRKVDGDISGELDLLPHFATTDDMVCYARCTIVAPEEMDIDMSLGSNDGAKVWLNGEEVFSWYGGRAAAPHQNTIPVHLNAGSNEVMVKVANLGANWGLYLSFRDPERELEIN